MSDIFFYASKLVWIIIRPETWLFLLIFIATVAFRAKAAKLAMRALLSATILFLLVAVFPLGNLVLAPLESRFPANPRLSKVDGIIVLGGAELASLSMKWDQPQLNGSGERILAGMYLARRFPAAKLVYSGGSGSMTNQAASESAVARKIFVQQGIGEDRVFVESSSRNTFENAAFTKLLVQPGKDQTWVLVTSASHMPRSVGVFCRAGWKVHPYPVDYRSGVFAERVGWNFTRNLLDINTGVKEWVGLLFYWLTKKTSSVLPDQC